MISIQASDAEILEEMRRIRVLYTLKRTMRYKSTRDDEVHSESVAEHIFAMFVLAQYFLPLEDAEGALDKNRIWELILFHEIGEIETGDILFHQKGAEERVRERKAARSVTTRLPEVFHMSAVERFEEFEEATTAESKFVNAIDKIEPIFELFDERELSLNRQHNITRDIALKNKIPATESFPHMRRFLDVWADYAASHGGFSA